MKDIELANAIVEYLSLKARILSNHTDPVRFTPKEVPQAVGGAYSRAGGEVAKQVISQLRSMWIEASYKTVGNKIYIPVSEVKVVGGDLCVRDRSNGAENSLYYRYNEDGKMRACRWFLALL